MNNDCLKKDMLPVSCEVPDGSQKQNRSWYGRKGCGKIRLYLFSIMKETGGVQMNSDAARIREKQSVNSPLDHRFHPDHDLKCRMN